MDVSYLPLAEYSSKYKVSISTLRRKIKADDIRFVFEEGKYLIYDEPMSTHQRTHRPSPKSSEDTLMGAHVGTSTTGVVKEAAPMLGQQPAKTDKAGKPIHRPMTAAQRSRGPAGGKVPQSPSMGGGSRQGRVLQAEADLGFSAAEMGEFEETPSRISNEPLEESILATANKLLGELKKAYSQILQEKEQQILNLKEEVSDLKTLVRVLEGK